MVVTFNSNKMLNNSGVRFGAELKPLLVNSKARQSFTGGADKLVVNAGKEAIAAAGKTNVGSRVITAVVTKFKRAMAFCAATVAGAVLLVRNVGDDIKVKSPKVKFKPIKILKDGVGKLTHSIGKTVEKTADSGVADFTDTIIEGASQTVGVDIKKSALSIVWHKIKSFFGAGS